MPASLWALSPERAEQFLQQYGQEVPHTTPPVAPLGVRPTTPLAALAPDKSAHSQAYSVQNGVAVIGVQGVIDRTVRVSWYTGIAYTAGQDAIRSAVSQALTDASISAILLSFDSPGGVVAGVKELGDFLAEAATQKPMAAYADGLCASAAYWLASATGTIYAPQTASVGSIGVIAVLTDWSKALEKAGIVRSTISGGKWKAAGNPDQPLSDDDRDYFQAHISQLHDIFRTDAASRMGITASPDLWAEGQTLLADDAQKLGLVTAVVRDQNAAIAALANLHKPKENIMDIATLKAQHPDLYQQAVAEGKNAALAEAAQAHSTNMVQARQEARQEASADTLALVKAVAGEEMAIKIGTFAELGFTPAQLAALSPLLSTVGASASQNSDPNHAHNNESVARAAMLNAITAAHGSPLPQAEIPTQTKSSLVADAERRAHAQRI